MNARPDPELELTKVDGLIRLQRARYYLTGYYGGQRDENDLQAVEQIIRPLEHSLLSELGVSDEASPPPKSVERAE